MIDVKWNHVLKTYSIVIFGWFFTLFCLCRFSSSCSGSILLTSWTSSSIFCGLRGAFLSWSLRSGFLICRLLFLISSGSYNLFSSWSRISLFVRCLRSLGCSDGSCSGLLRNSFLLIDLFCSRCLFRLLLSNLFFSWFNIFRSFSRYLFRLLLSNLFFSWFSILRSFSSFGFSLLPLSGLCSCCSFFSGSSCGSCSCSHFFGPSLFSCCLCSSLFRNSFCFCCSLLCGYCYFRCFCCGLLSSSGCLCFC